MPNKALSFNIMHSQLLHLIPGEFCGFVVVVDIFFTFDIDGVIGVHVMRLLAAGRNSNAFESSPAL